MKKLLIIIVFIVATGLVGYFVFGTNFSKQRSIIKDPLFIADISKQIGLVWRNGEVAGDSVCKEFQNVDNLYYQCNPHFMACALNKKLLKIAHKRDRYTLKSTDEFKYHQTPNHREYIFEVAETNNPEESIKFRLKDSCREVYLPNRYYPFMANQRGVTIEWDSFNKEIYVDKFLIRVWEIIEWAKQIGRSDLIESFKKSPKHKVAVNLSLKDMNAFCSYQGKHILSARVSDAISIHPEDISDPEAKLFRAPYYPWARKNSQTKIFKLQKGELNKLDEKEHKQLCRKVYSLDCKNLDYTDYSGETVTWAGAYEFMGGPLEYVRNIIHPHENINLSSYFFKWSSKAHRLGMRGFWDGEGFALNNLKLKDIAIENKINEVEIAFRCMRFQ